MVIISALKVKREYWGSVFLTGEDDDPTCGRKESWLLGLYIYCVYKNIHVKPSRTDKTMNEIDAFVSFS